MPAVTLPVVCRRLQFAEPYARPNEEVTGARRRDALAARRMIDIERLAARVGLMYEVS